ncbi:MAG: hypothetical protein Q9208_005664 [Pyrenodesmia sp. 3 TL-2023]
MISVPDADLSPAPSRYYAADFHKLTNRRASSPSTPDYALPNRVLPARRTLPPADTADRRAFSRQDASPCVVQGAPAISRARQGSGSSIKEDAGGEITRNFVITMKTKMPSRQTAALARAAVDADEWRVGELQLVEEATAEPGATLRPELASPS